ncbi:hypothetical protein ASPVEDRAFT_179566 [Aspergillus versicolor CBS 583.65]|uniref:Zn(2)-C6 fungal-type domain-containing protein n=1 Tax=Aspergillus versicolor CBS 583.65 TaxID=1036611 RepID=A0A1L9Q3G2_ASPVE|nr:uncharacterized protein ASPVEDRAFT_179566 [Aspergillus versicolor CBS 583.65]OJJ08304.1 hypothetical protein ASPVEDRAFT_179566 [Aspergillus versicolor CBS 583.65]
MSPKGHHTLSGLNRPEFVIGKPLPACDLCHSRKVKCDREQTCNNCAAAKAPCIRSRQRPPRRVSKRQRAAPISRSTSPSQANNLSSERPRCSSYQPALYSPHAAHKESPPERLGRTCPSTPRDTRKLISLPLVPEPSDQTDSTGNLLIRQELDSNTNLSSDRINVLESALALVRKFVATSERADAVPHEPGIDSDLPIPQDVSMELFYMMFSGQGSGGPVSLNHWPDHLPLQTLERMCLALVNRTVDGQIAVQYKVCVFSRATMFVTRWLRLCPSDDLARCLVKSKKSYAAACLQCLREVDLTGGQSLLMLQTLLSGAHLVQLLGDSSRSWFLTACAARALVALGYHQSSRITADTNEGFEIRHCVFWCYYFDKTLSMLLVRPSSLPDMQFAPGDLVHTDSDDPLTIKVKILVRLAQVQDAYLPFIVGHKRAQAGPASARLDALETELRYIHEDVIQFRPQCTNTPTLMIEWDALNFTFYSIATTVLRLNPSSLHDRGKREQCLQYAREALWSMQACQKHLDTITHIATDFLFWTALLYPLTPFFVVFCNVVATSNVHDLRLLNEVTATISKVKEQCAFGMNLYIMLSELIAMCTQLHDVQPAPSQLTLHGDSLVEASPQAERAAEPASHTSLMSDGQPVSSSSHPISPMPALDQSATASAILGQQPFSSTTAEAESGHASIWEEDLMSELFNIQPSVQWFDTDYYNLFGIQ